MNPRIKYDPKRIPGSARLEIHTPVIISLKLSNNTLKVIYHFNKNCEIRSKLYLTPF